MRMRCRHQLGPAGGRVLAVLLLADGGWVSSGALSVASGAGHMPMLIWRLKRDHGAPIVGCGTRPRRYRLTDLPPECCLESVLVLVHRMEREDALPRFLIGRPKTEGGGRGEEELQRAAR